MLRSKLIGSWYKKNKSAAPCDDVIMSDWVWRIKLCHQVFHARTLDLANDAFGKRSLKAGFVNQIKINLKDLT